MSKVEKSRMIEIRADFRANRRNPKIQFVLLMYRLASRLRSSKLGMKNPLTIPVGVTYRVIVEWILGIELPWKTNVGSGLRIYHGYGLVVNDASVLGRDVVLRQGVTIGHRVPGGACPTIGDGVEIGANATIIGGVKIGEYAKIGANALVVEDVPARAIVLAPLAAVRSEKS